MAYALAGKTAIVTGASSGIGEGIAARLIQEGANVVAVSRGLESLRRSLDALPSERVAAVAGDAGDEATATRAVQEAVERFGGLDLLVNNVGNALSGDVTAIEPDAWADLLRSNITSAYLFSRAAIPELRKTQGSIIQISSVQSFRGDYRAVAYNTTKAALNNMTRSMALDHAVDGIRVNAVAPGFIETPRTAGAPASLRDAILGSTPLRRAGTPADVAAAVVFLAGDEASYITGVILPVDGGLQAGGGINPAPAR